MTAALLERRGPWTLPQALTTIGAFGVGTLGVVLGWFGTSGESMPADQVLWVGVAALGLGIAGAGSALLLLHGRRAVGERRRVLIPSSDERAGIALVGLALEPVERPVGRADQYVAGSNMSKYHRAECLLVAGKSVKVATVGVHTAAGRRPCGVCLPPTA